MTEETDILSNQTAFSSEEPLLQSDQVQFNEVVDLDPEATAEAAKIKQAKQKRQKLYLIGGGIGGFLILILLLAVALQPQKVVQQTILSPSPSPVSQVNRNQFQARLDELNTDLMNADPSKQNLAIPPVDLSITLDPIPTQ